MSSALSKMRLHTYVSDIGGGDAMLRKSTPELIVLVTADGARLAGLSGATPPTAPRKNICPTHQPRCVC
eukprot:6482077-Amphidinium_carterae.1